MQYWYSSLSLNRVDGAKIYSTGTVGKYGSVLAIEDISRFLDQIQRQYEIANVNFCEYVVERLEFAIGSCNNLLDRLNAPDVTTFIDDEERAIILTDCLHA